jgi:hypothetical protein
MEQYLAALFVILIVGIAFFILCREFVCWYFKFSAILTVLEKIEKKLQK